jgi:hypothetical protein
MVSAIESLIPPPDVSFVEGSLSTLWMDGGVLYSKGKSVTRTIPLLKENFNHVRRLTKGELVCLITEATDLPELSKEIREFMAEELNRHFKAMAIISHSQFGALVSNIFLFFNKPRIPTKMFNSLKEAQEWVKQF